METKNSNEIKEFKFNCEKCNYKCQYECQWLKHCDTELHKTGQRKKIIRKNHKKPEKCKLCD